ncbi:MAG TPA: phosphatase PAP2 family protein [Myxococcota bacterium]|nr:phosphatase PAP2 family protein [Myxococcota bacterium]
MHAHAARLAGWLTGFALALAAPAAAEVPRTAEEVLGPRIDTSGTVAVSRPRPRPRVDALHFWNGVAIDASGLDHTPVAPGETRTFGEQLGPGRASRAMAIVHIAIFEALNSIAGSYQGILGLPRAPLGVSPDAAIAQAAHDTLVALYPSQRASFDAVLASELARVRLAFARKRGVDVGRRAAAAILARRANDGAAHAEPLMGSEYVPSDDAGVWRQDPISLVPIALGGHWGEVDPFVIPSGAQFRAPVPPALSSPEYAAAFNEAQSLGGDGITTPTLRTVEQTQIGIFWAYDGTPSLCAPPRLYNQIATQIAKQRGTSMLETARLLALVNVAMADAGIAVWESKYYYHYWRPVAGIREADAGTGPSGTGDDNPDTQGDAAFSPLGAPASNLAGPNFTPPFPAYPSGHAGFGGALFQTLRLFYRTDAISFTFVSDELNGITRDNTGAIRPLLPRSFQTLSQAEEENGQSRIYLGIHWSFDKTEGIAQGRSVASYVFQNLYRRRR